MKISHRIASVTGLALLLGCLLISLSSAPAAANTDAMPAVTATGWEEIGPGSASGGGVSQSDSLSFYPSLAIGPDGLPVLAWQDKGSGNYEIYVKRWNGSVWTEIGPSSASGGGISQTGSASRPSLAIGPDSNPVVAWEDFSSNNPEVYVKRWGGSAWVEMGAGSASGGGISQTRSAVSPSLAIGPDGNPVVAWEDFSSSSYSLITEIYVKRWDGSAWVEMGPDFGSGGDIIWGHGHSEDPSLAIGPDGNPIVAWGDRVGNNYEIYVKRWDGSAWVEMGAGSGTGGGISNNDGLSTVPSLAISPDGVPIIAWNDNRGIYIKRWDGSAWVEMGADSASHDGISNPNGSSSNPSLAISPDGIPVVAWNGYSDGNYRIYVKQWDGSAWVEMGAGSASGGGINQGIGDPWHLSLAIGPDGLPAVAWEDRSDSNFQIYARRYVPTCYGLTLSHTGQGDNPTAGPAKSYACPDGQYVAGQPITLAAAPAGGWRVKNWSGTDDDTSLMNSNAVTMPADDWTISVNYEEIPPLTFHTFIPAMFHKP